MPTAAICLFGTHVRFVGRFDLGFNARNARLTRLAAESLQKNVIAANPSVLFDVYWVGTSAPVPALLAEALAVRNGSYGGERLFRLVPSFRAIHWPAQPPSSSNMFLSIEAVMALRSERQIDHDFVLLARLDATWLSPLDLDATLTPGAVHMAHWCAAEGNVDNYDVHGRQCGKLRSRMFEIVAPDFYLMGRTEIMTRVFDTLLVDYLHRTFIPTYSGSENHKILSGRLRNLSVPTHRRLYHNFDIALPRKGSFDPEKSDCVPHWRKPPSRKGWPLCDASAMVCTCGWKAAWHGGAWPRVQ